MRELNILPGVLDVQHSRDLTTVTYDGWMRPAFLLLLVHCMGDLYWAETSFRGRRESLSRLTLLVVPCC